MRVEPSCIGLVPYKRDPTESSSLFHHVRTQRESDSYGPGRELSPECNHAGPLILDFLDSRTVRNKFVLLISYPV